MSRLNMRHSQRGATLAIGLIMLVLITLMVVAAFNLSTSNLKAVGNMQSRKEAVAATNAAIEEVISSSAIFATPAARSISVGGYTVAVATPVCLYATDVIGNSSADANPNIVTTGSAGTVIGAPTGYKNTYWDIAATVNDAASGASVETHQGIKIALPSTPNPCP